MIAIKPFWKNSILFLITILGTIYSIPNLYSEKPAIQIAFNVPSNIQQLQQQIITLLQKNHAHYHGIRRTSSNQIEILFDSTDLQLYAKDLIKNHFNNNNYTIALNLVATIPNWLNKIGAVPMKQGLDLRGGIHFLLEVDVNSVINRYYEGLMKNISHTLREATIRYVKIYYKNNQGILLSFKNQQIMHEAINEIKNNDYAQINIKLQKNNTLLLVLSKKNLNNIRKNTLEQTISILRNRTNELGIGEAIVQQQGATRVAVDLPGIQDAARAKQILGGTATLEFHLVDQEQDPVIAQNTGTVQLNSKLYTINGQPILLKRLVVLSGDAITSAMSSFDQQTGSASVQIQLGGGGESLFNQITRDNIGKRMAIVFVENKTIVQKINDQDQIVTHREERVISAPTIQNALGNNFQITGLSNNKEASDLALLLRAGALPATIYPIEERTVGPSLGKENIHRGLISLEVGMGLILILMPIYYRFFGMVANIGLFLNLILLSALLSLMGATLTLPGIAGFVLTIGMAVDANVLIYERIREELRNNIAPRTALTVGYDKAFTTILDANITTLIVGIILFAIGTGPIKGFAIILCLGLITSMLTSVTYTRAMINWYYRKDNNKKLSIGI